MVVLVALFLFASGWLTKDPAQWTDEDAGQILSDSPWTAPAKLYQSLDSATARPKRVPVTIQWQSALPVRLAMAKKDGKAVDPSTMTAFEDYVVIVEGLPAKEYGLTPRKLKSSISLIRSGHERIYPLKVDMPDSQSVIFHFPKKDPIALGDKHVEFQLFMKKIHLNRKFVLKEMQFRGQLEL
jgi:hypothetical protein